MDHRLHGACSLHTFIHCSVDAKPKPLRSEIDMSRVIVVAVKGFGTDGTIGTSWGMCVVQSGVGFATPDC